MGGGVALGGFRGIWMLWVSSKTVQLSVEG